VESAKTAKEGWQEFPCATWLHSAAEGSVQAGNGQGAKGVRIFVGFFSRKKLTSFMHQASALGERLPQLADAGR